MDLYRNGYLVNEYVCNILFSQLVILIELVRAHTHSYLYTRYFIHILFYFPKNFPSEEKDTCTSLFENCVIRASAILQYASKVMKFSKFFLQIFDHYVICFRYLQERLSHDTVVNNLQSQLSQGKHRLNELESEVNDTKSKISEEKQEWLQFQQVHHRKFGMHTIVTRFFNIMRKST